MTPQDYLLHELGNVKLSLQETLRHDYAPGRGQKYYDECMGRIERIRTEIQALSPTDSDGIVSAAHRLSILVSQPISLIERSHLGEFSWPFAEELEHITIPLCTEPDPAGGTLDPVIHLLADGGLTSYRIYTESLWPDPIRHKRILNVVFPRSLKHHVLLHPIFGHEIGHAAWAVPHRRAALNTDVLIPLFKGTRFEDAVKAEAWLNDKNRPAQITAYLSKWTSQQQYPISFAGPNNPTHYFWQQEFFCDLFGVLTFGPSFAGAHKALLGTFDPAGTTATPSHPLYGARALLVARAFRRLGWLDVAATGNAQIDSAIAAFKAYVNAVPVTDPWYELFTDAQIDAAILGARKHLGGIPDVLYGKLTGSDIREVIESIIRRVPPALSSLSEQGGPVNRRIDFRHILFAGWAAWIGRAALPEMTLDFFDVNRLCDRSILHQRAIAQLPAP